ncbi:MAG: polyprenyl synthetase family protein [Candidatus Gastranaerophilaceae bacterium]|jgi:all-trans-nonaprenyl-diphosphate synthase
MNALSRLDDILKPITDDMEKLNKDLLSLISSDNEFLKDITMHIVSVGGKRLRPAIVFMMARALNDGQLFENHNKLAIAIELIHTATLVHDDVIDNADKRRNKPTINKLWDERIAVIAGDYLLSQSLIKLSEINEAEIVKMFACIMKEVCEGEIQQHLQFKKVITIEEYVEKSRRKTALLFALAAKASAAISTDDENKIKSAESFGMNFGITFQIMDDILNLENSTDKPFLSDLKNGVITAPVIYAIEENSEIKEYLAKENIDYEKLYKMITNTKGMEKAKLLAFEYKQKAFENLSEFNEDIYRTALIELLKFCFKRN